MSSYNDSCCVVFTDILAWEVEDAEPDAGQTVDLRKYLPIDMLQLPTKCVTRDDAVQALRMCDHLCTLMDNEHHCVKNDKFLIASVIEHVFIQLVPVPKPRAVAMTSAQQQCAASVAAHRAKKAAEARAKTAESKAADPTQPPQPAPPSPPKQPMPNFDVGKQAQESLHAEECIWDQPITRELQVHAALLLLCVSCSISLFFLALSWFFWLRLWRYLCLCCFSACRCLSLHKSVCVHSQQSYVGARCRLNCC